MNQDILSNSILYIGSSDIYPKGFDRLLRIIKELDTQNFCLIMKDDYDINKLPIECRTRVKIYNKLTESDIVQIINSCVMGICTSYDETQHLAGLEICACNKPMVSYAVGFYYDFQYCHEWGIIADDSNIIEKIKYVFANSEKFTPRDFVIKNGFTYDAAKKSWMDIINNIP